MPPLNILAAFYIVLHLSAYQVRLSYSLGFHRSSWLLNRISFFSSVRTVWNFLCLLLHTSKNVYRERNWQFVCIAKGIGRSVEFIVTVRKDSKSKVTKPFCSCRRTEILALRYWLVRVAMDTVAWLSCRCTEPRNLTCVCSKWDRLCA